MDKIIGFIDYAFTDAGRPKSPKHLSKAYDMVNEKFLIYDEQKRKWEQLPYDWQYLDKVVIIKSELKDIHTKCTVGILATKEVGVMYNINTFEPVYKIVTNVEHGDAFIVRYVLEGNSMYNAKLISTLQGWVITGTYEQMREMIKTEVAKATESCKERIRALELEIDILKEGGNI